jgi:outer membrane receptor for ferrienterochelin and colicin
MAVMGMAHRLCLIVLLVLCGLPFSKAQDDGAPEAGEEESLLDEFALLEEEIAVDEISSASKHRQSIFWSPSSVSVYTREQILRSGAINLPDFLRRIPGFDVFDTKGGVPFVGARAMTDESNNSILLLIDGREEMIEVSGFPVWGATVASLSQIERIEVIRGPGSALYGANAYAGVVIITTLPDRPDVGADVELNLGELKRRQIFGRVRGSYAMKSGVLTFVGSAGIDRRADPSYRAGTTYQSDLKARGVVRYRIGQKLDLSLDAGFQTASGDTHLIIGDLSAKPGAILAHEMVKAKFKLGENTKLAAQLFHNWYEFSFQTRMRIWALGTWVTDLPDMDTFNHSIDGQVQVDHQATERILFIFGGNLRYTSNDTPQFSPAFVDDVRGAGFVHAEWKPTDTLQLTGGLRLDLNSQTDMALSPRAVMVVRPYPDHAFRLGYGLAFRKPSIIESRLHYKIPEGVYNPAMPEIVDLLAEQFGNENLKNEKVISTEIGWRARLLDERLQVSVDLFYNLYQDTIIYKTELAVSSLGMPDIGNSTLRFVNLEDEFMALGGEAEISWRLLSNLTLWANLTARAVFNNDTDEVLENEPKVRVNLGCTYNPDQGPVADVALHYVSEYRPLGLNPVDPLEGLVPQELGNVFLLIARLGYRLEFFDWMRLEAGLAIRSPLGSPFREFVGYPYRQVETVLDRRMTADFGGMLLVRMAEIYLRGSI